MQRTEFIITFIAFIVAILVAFGVYHLVYTAPKMQPHTERCPAPIVMKEVMVATNIVNTGDPIFDSITYEKWPQSTLREGFLLKNQIPPEQLKSLIARRIINQGEPISKTSVVDRRDHGVLSAILKEGMRAVSLALDSNAGMAGLLNPGDIVDVIVALNDPDKSKGTADFNRTLLCGVRVLAIDQHLSSLIDFVNKKGIDTSQLPKSVTLEVTPQQASVLASAVKIGTISLSLHSTSDGKNTCVESSLKPIDQIKIIRGDGASSSQKP